MRPRRTDTVDLLESALDAWHALFWCRFWSTRKTRGPRLAALDERSTEALAKLPDDLAEYVIAHEAGEIRTYGALRDVLARRCARQ